MHVPVCRQTEVFTLATIPISVQRRYVGFVPAVMKFISTNPRVRDRHSAIQFKYPLERAPDIPVKKMSMTCVLKMMSKFRTPSKLSKLRKFFQTNQLNFCLNSNNYKFINVDKNKWFESMYVNYFGQMNGFFV